MRMARRTVKALLCILVLCELYVAWQLWRHGLPMLATGVQETKPGEVSFGVSHAPISAQDWLVLVLVLAIQIALVWFLWWSRRRAARA